MLNCYHTSGHMLPHAEVLEKTHQGVQYFCNVRKQVCEEKPDRRSDAKVFFFIIIKLKRHIITLPIPLRLSTSGFMLPWCKSA